jgi:UrcA family protein
MTLGALAMVAALALQRPVRADTSHSTKVSIADVDLTTSDGMKAASERIRTAARLVCSRATEANDLSHRENYLACVDDAMAAALQQLRPPGASVARNATP